jgi:hypothetical protein
MRLSATGALRKTEQPDMLERIGAIRKVDMGNSTKREFGPIDHVICAIIELTRPRASLLLTIWAGRADARVLAVAQLTAEDNRRNHSDIVF